MHPNEFVDACLCLGWRAASDLVSLFAGRKVFEQQEELVGGLVTLHVEALWCPNVERVTKIAIKRRLHFVASCRFTGGTTPRVIAGELGDQGCRHITRLAEGEMESSRLRHLSGADCLLVHRSDSSVAALRRQCRVQAFDGKRTSSCGPVGRR